MLAELTALLSDLVAIDSVNPSLVAGGAGEGRIARFVADWANGQGLEAELVEGTPARPTTLVRTRCRGGGPTVLLCGHLDTVNVEGMADPHRPRIDADRLYGRGAYDMKAGVAAALIAAREAARARLRRDLVVGGIPGQEHGSLGVQEALRSVHADGAVVPEPTEMELVVAHKGFVWSELEVTGVAAHGSRPHLGVDAIVKAGPLLTALGELDVALGERTHRLLGRGSVHASVIEGGVELSSYPARCVVGLERRTPRGETRADIERALDALLERCRTADPELVVQQRTLLVREPFEVDAESEFVHAVRESATEVLGSAPKIAGASYWADAAFISAAGIPTVMFGPSGEGAHAVEEWVSLADTEAVTRTLIALAARVCG